MTREEFIEKRNEINRNCESQIANLEIEYVKSNRKYKIGDTICSNYGESIIIDSIQYGKKFTSTLPTTIYTGYMLTKKGELRKDRSRLSIYQENIVE